MLYDDLGQIDLQIKRTRLTASSPENVYDFHAHSESEIYVNITGDISFAVGDKLYTIQSGDVLIIPPYEYHRCIYNGDVLHEHYWILFSAEKWKNFGTFYQSGNMNSRHFRLSPENLSIFIEICDKIERKQKNDVEGYGLLFDFLRLLQNADKAEVSEISLGREMTNALNYISANYTMPISIEQVAKAAFVSINTLERHFKKYLKVTPSEYIKKKRLARAAQLLDEGETVMEACVKSGFNDCSAFIAMFRKVYGATPKKYKNQKK